MDDESGVIDDSTLCTLCQCYVRCARRHEDMKREKEAKLVQGAQAVFSQMVRFVSFQEKASLSESFERAAF